jgi:hypothetical protein
LEREKKGVTVTQVAEATRMMSQIVEDLERDDFRRIAAPIYGRGFIKLYAEYLSLEAEPLMREFMEVYTGTRTPKVAPQVVVPLPHADPSAEPVVPLPARTAPIGESAAEGAHPPSAAPANLTRPASPGEPDLFSLAAVRSEAGRSVADPAGETQPPRIRPAEAAVSPVQEGAPRPPRKFSPPGASDPMKAASALFPRWRLTRRQLMIGGGVIVGVVLLALLVRGCRKSPAQPRPPVSVERVLKPAAPYFD